MDAVDIALLVVAAIFIVGSLGEAIFRKTGIPDVVWLIAVGVILGPVAGLVTTAQLLQIAPLFAAITLVVVLFQGGSQLQLADLTKSLTRALFLALLGFALVVAVVTSCVLIGCALGWLPESWGLLHGIMLGSIVGGSSSVVVMPAMALARCEPRVASLVSLESAFTDVFCVVGASVSIQLLSAEASGLSPALALAKSFGIALAIGLGMGVAGIVLMVQIARSEHAYTFTLASLMGLYVLVGQLGGSAALAVLTFAVVIGNAPAIGRMLNIVREPKLGIRVTMVHDQIAFIIKSFFFTFMGLMLGPPWALFALGIGAGLVLYLARLIAVRVALAGHRWGPSRRALVGACLPRGLAAGVLATLPSAAGVKDTEALPPFVFAAVVTTIVIFAVAFPRAKKRVASEPGEPAPLEAATMEPSIEV